MDDFIGGHDDMQQIMDDVIEGVFIDRQLEALEMISHGLGTRHTDTLAPPPRETSHNVVCVPPPGETDSVTVREVPQVHIRGEVLRQISSQHVTIGSLTVESTGLSDDSSNNDSNAAIDLILEDNSSISERAVEDSSISERAVEDISRSERAVEDSSSSERAVEDSSDSDNQLDIQALDYDDNWTDTDSIYSDWTDSDEEDHQSHEATRLTNPQLMSHQCSSDTFNQLLPSDQQQPSQTTNTIQADGSQVQRCLATNTVQADGSQVQRCFTTNTVQADGSQVQRCLAAKRIARKYYKFRKKRRTSRTAGSLTRHRFTPSTSCKRKVDQANHDVPPPRPPPPRPKRRRVKSNDDLFIKHLTPCDELRFMARDLHFKWITLSEAKRRMDDIFDRADKAADFWRQRNVDCSHQTLVKTCCSESALQVVYNLMAGNRESGDVISVGPTVSDYTPPGDVMEYLMTDSDGH